MKVLFGFVKTCVEESYPVSRARSLVLNRLFGIVSTNRLLCQPVIGFIPLTLSLDYEPTVESHVLFGVLKYKVSALRYSIFTVFHISATVKL